METIVNAIIRTGKKKFGLSFDSEDDILIIEITERPEKGKANKEIIKELKKIFNSQVELVSGLKSKKKRIKISLPKQEVLNLLSSTN